MSSRFWCSRRFFAPLVFLASVIAAAHSVSAQVIDFETLTPNQAVFGFDINSDGINDVVFSSTDPLGFNTAGPNPDTQVHASGLVLETSSVSDPDIRVDFLGGATSQLQFGFALLTDAGELDQGVRFEVFDEADIQVASSFQRGELLPITTALGSAVSGFPEGLISVSFSGVASYALFDATTTGTRFVIDDFTGTFSPAAIPEPASLTLVGLGGVILLGRRKKALFV